MKLSRKRVFGGIIFCEKTAASGWCCSGERSVPENVNKRAVEKFKELLERAEGEDYRIYNVAVGVK